MLKWKSVIQSMKKLFKQVLAFLCDQHLILFFILTIGVKLALFNAWVIKVTWPTNQYQCGVIFGFLSAAIIFLPFYFVRKHKSRLVFLLAFLISFLILIDTIYFSYFSALPGVGTLSSIGQAKDIGPAIWELLNWGLLLYFVDIALAIILFKPINRLTNYVKDKFNLPKSNYKMSILVVIITAVLFGLALLPMGGNSLADVTNRGYDTVSTAQHYGLLGAHAIDLARFVEEETAHLSAEQEKTITDWVKNNKPSREATALTGVAKGKNVIMIQVESLGGFVINQEINGKEITPYLNKLAKTSRFFPNDRFLYGAGHTSDTDFTANSSYFPLNDAAVFVRYGRDDFTSLPKTLAANGYSAFVYHGFNRNFWNRDTALKSLGYQRFFAADNYPKGMKINMGLNDGDFLDKTAEYIKEQPKPSLSYAITLSSHVPFSTNDQTKELGINVNDYPNQVGGYLEDINYVDRMLEKFFDKLKSEKLYDDSLIVVYGDHNPILPAFTAGTIKYDPDTVQGKEVPLFIKLPNETTGKTYTKKGAHLDITPTILDLLGIKTNQLMFGQSLFAGESDEFKTCPNQITVFASLGDCDAALADEKNMSEKIIRYNLFNKLPK